MSKKFNIISFVLIIVLTLILIMVMFRYYTRENVIDTLNQSSQLNYENIEHIISSSGESDVNGSKEILNAESGDSILKSNPSGDINEKFEENSQRPNNIQSPGTSVIISSNDEISNKEKKEVLKELDQTLMELLDVVDKVQTVDESRLAEESEGQE